MVRIEDFYIKFDEKWSVYHPGDQVTGSVSLRLNDKIFVDSVSAHFYGLARVMWIQREPKEGTFRSQTYSSERVYFNEKLELWRYDGEKEKSEASKPVDPFDLELEQMLKPPLRRGGQLMVQSGPHLTPGSHQFSFSFRLPSDLPTSFDAQYSDGYIRYSVKICLMAQDAIKHSRKAYFTVVKPKDLNLMYPTIRQPACEETSKTCKNGLFGQPTPDCFVRLRAQMEKRGYVPGEPVNVTVEIENRAKKSIKSLKMHLVQNLVCHVDQPEVESNKTTHRVASISKMDKLRQGGKSIWNAGPLYIPAVVPSFIVENSMEVSYSVVIEAYRDHDWPKLHLELPIVVGTVPLEVGQIEKSMESSFGPPPAYDVIGIPPPTYEESVAGICGGNEKEDEACIPRYLVYNFQ